MSIDSSRPLAVDLFAGAGGLSLGLEQAGYEVAAAVEYDPIHAATHEFNFPEAKVYCRDVSSITGEEIRDASGIGSQDIQLVAGGPPCQGFSTMGKRALDDPRNQLIGEYARLVGELTPRYFLMENVAGLTVGDHRKLLEETIEAMDAAGYDVLVPYQVLQASDFGVPQSRKRLFLLGSRKGLPVPTYPMATTTGRRLDGALPPNPQKPIGPSVLDAIGDLPDADRYKALLKSDQVRATFGEPSEYAARLRFTGRDPENYGHSRQNSQHLLTSSTRTSHTVKSIERFADAAPGKTENISRFLRLHPEGVSNTLRAGTASDRGAHTAPRPIHYRYPRVITVREAARLHSFPDWFRLHATKWNGFRQIGNAVPPLLARAVAAEILRVDGIAPSEGEIRTLGQGALLNLTASGAQRHFGITERVIPQRTRTEAA